MGVAKAPEPLTDSHLLVEFDCGNEALNEWLKKHALKNQNSGASRTFVISEGKRVVGFYALASGSVERISAPAAIARNMPEAVPVMVLGRLAVERAMQGQGLGAALLKDALLRTLAVTRNAGVRAVLVHAISEDARRFYLRYGFRVSHIDPMTLMLPVQRIESLLQAC